MQPQIGSPRKVAPQAPRDAKIAEMFFPTLPYITSRLGEDLFQKSELYTHNVSPPQDSAL